MSKQTQESVNIEEAILEAVDSANEAPSIPEIERILSTGAKGPQASRKQIQKAIVRLQAKGYLTTVRGFPGNWAHYRRGLATGAV